MEIIPSNTSRCDSRKVGIQLLWPGKPVSVAPPVATFESFARIPQARNETAFEQTVGLFDNPPQQDQERAPWLNKLMQGDNKTALYALVRGPLGKEIEAAGGVKLIYIDPPFYAGTDYSTLIPIGQATESSPKNAIQETAYRDTWHKGLASYLSMIHERLVLMRDLLAPDGSIWVHCDWRVNFLIRAIMNEVFGEDAFRNEIIWYYRNKIPDTRKRQYTNSTDTIYYYALSPKSVFEWQFDKRDKPIKVSRMKKVNGKKIYLKDESGKGLYDVREYRTADNVWQFPLLHAQPEIVGYPTQKPEKLLERIILTASRPGDLVADFFCGSGTTLAVAERLGRRWIGCDAGRVAVQASMKRLVLSHRNLAAAGKSYGGFEVLKEIPGERSGSGQSSKTRCYTKDKRPDTETDHYTKIVLDAYDARFLPQGRLLRGEKHEAGIAICSPNRFVDSTFLEAVVDEAMGGGIFRVDVLSQQFDGGLKAFVLEEAPRLGVRMRLRRIVFDTGPQDERMTGNVLFDEVPYVCFAPRIRKSSAVVAITGIGFLRPDDEELEPASFGTKTNPFVTLRNGKIERVSRTKKGEMIHEILSPDWRDWVDYWAVDFEYGSPAQRTDGAKLNLDRDHSYTRPVFHEHWQSFRTRKNSAIEFTSATHSYSGQGRYTIAVRMTDIVGNEAFERVVVEV